MKISFINISSAATRNESSKPLTLNCVQIDSIKFDEPFQ